MTQADKVKITRVAIVLDKSGSMKYHAPNVIKVVDEHIKWLAGQAVALNQEIRVTVIAFGSSVETLIYDTGVQWLPSIKDLYSPTGNTALIDATIFAQTELRKLDDLTKLAKIVWEYNYLTFVFTDGYENYSRQPAHYLRDLLKRQADNWTVACMVPDVRGKIAAEQYGFAPGNVEVWNSSSSQGVEDAGRTLRGATETYLTNINAGVRGSRNLFHVGGADQVNAQTIDASGLKPLDPSQFMLIPVANPGNRLAQSVKKRDPKQRQCVLISDFVEATGRRYVVGKTFYQLGDMTEVVQANKLIAAVDNRTAKVYLGAEARKLLQLPDTRVRVKKDPNGRYDVYIASHATNRLLPIGSQILLLN
jgi:hypothetical protein